MRQTLRSRVLNEVIYTSRLPTEYIPSDDHEGKFEARIMLRKL